MGKMNNWKYITGAQKRINIISIDCLPTARVLRNTGTKNEARAANMAEEVTAIIVPCKAKVACSLTSIRGGRSSSMLKESEINGVAKFWSDQGEPEFDALAMRALDGGPTQSSFAGMSGEGAEYGGDLDGADEEYDEKYDEILSWASTQKAISASLIQRRFKLGYPRAARLIEVFEKEGVVGPANGSKPRAVLVASHAG